MVAVPLHPLLLVTASVTVCMPGAAYSQEGFCSDEVSAVVDGSPKFHDQLLMVPYVAVEASLNKKADW